MALRDLEAFRHPLAKLMLKGGISGQSSTCNLAIQDGREGWKRVSWQKENEEK